MLKGHLILNRLSSAITKPGNPLGNLTDFRFSSSVNAITVPKAETEYELVWSWRGAIQLVGGQMCIVPLHTLGIFYGQLQTAGIALLFNRSLLQRYLRKG